MDTLLIPVQVLAGFLIGYTLTVIPGLTLVGYILCSYLGPYTLISYFSCSMVLSTYRELVTPQLSGNPDVTSSYSFSKGGVAVSKIREIASMKFCLLMSGILVAIFFNNIGFRGLPTLLSWSLVLFYLIFTLGVTKNATNGVIWLVVIAVMVKLFDSMGASNSLLAVMTSFGFAMKDMPRQDQSYDLSNAAIVAPRSFIYGIFGGMIPGLSARNVVSLAFSRNFYLNGILCRVVAEGFNLGTLLLQKSTSKSIICTYLSELLKGVAFNSVGLIITVVVVGSVACNWVGLWNLMHDQISADTTASFYMPMVSIGTILYFSIVPNNLIGTFVIAGVLYAAGMIFAENIKSGDVPEETRNWLVGAPLLMRF